MARRFPSPSGSGYVWTFCVGGYFLLVATYVGIVAGIGAVWSFFGMDQVGSGRAAAWAESVVSIVPIALTVWLLMPLYGVFMTLLYYDRRIRLEGYDVDTLVDAAERARRVSRFQL
jgi:hypothetical protein